jgi:hypothetical protein
MVLADYEVAKSLYEQAVGGNVTAAIWWTKARMTNATLAAWFGAFEEPPRMSSERNTCLQKADDAKQRAAQATEPSIKSAYEKVAEHWKLLARLESLISREKNNEDT